MAAILPFPNKGNIMNAKHVFTACSFIFVGALSSQANTAGKVSLSGTIIDNHCAAANADKLGEFVKTHTKDCVLAPDCKASGFALYTSENKLMPFKKANSKKIEMFLEKKNSSLNVKVSAEEVGDSLDLVSIKNGPMTKK